MASTHSPSTPGTATRLLEHPSEQPPDAAPDQGSRHRMPRQTRSGGPLIGVTAMAASLGATGFAAATPAAAATPPAPAPAVAAPDESSTIALSADPGLALAARIQQQADGQRTSADETARLAAAKVAEAKRAAQQAEAQAHAKAEAEAEAAVVAEAEQAVDLGTFTLPTTNYTLTAHYGQSGSYWAHLHTGLDFAAPNGTPVTALGAGTVTSAGWSGAYGYRVIQTLPDGTEVWYCHLSAITTTSGPVTPGTPIGKVGATGNVTGPHLHLEVRPDGAAPIDPLPWLQAHGVQP
ncbi:M23 family metallopeptidase [Kitasatospora sp. MAP5-34]|uniref:M23 family metallopeptidase n=1 Tax=Kitasatospora sp. MAP5-34 TaxID=3035102 RepID=UPI002475E6B1|nr:M23 family metallopeptidase [Kitasatospora sp. MAP5-34]MDH6578767.1 murein DD-endopeptidase MepM/ murein hydrolase activator NlpD [Kitasatospora sp. MAP5-34]